MPSITAITLRLGLAVGERPRHGVRHADDAVVGVHPDEHVLGGADLAAGEAQGLPVRDGVRDRLHPGDLHRGTSVGAGGRRSVEEEAVGLEHLQDPGDQGGVVVGAVRQAELGEGGARDVAEHHPGQGQGADRLRDERDAEACGDERQQHGGARGPVLHPRGEPGLATGAVQGLVHGRVVLGVGDEVLAAQVGQRDRRLRHQPVVGGQGQHQVLHGDGAHGQPVGAHRQPEHAEVEAAGEQPLGLGGGEEVGVDLQRDAGQLLLDQAGDARELAERRGPGERDADQARRPRRCGRPPAPRPRRPSALPRLLEEDSPAGVRLTWRVVRGQQRGAELGLQLAHGLRQGGLGEVSRAAARPKCRVSATATKYRRCLSSTMPPDRCGGRHPAVLRSPSRSGH